MGQTSRDGKGTYGGQLGQRVEEQGTWASRTRKHSEAGYRRPVDRGAWKAKPVKRPRQQPAQPQYANYWAPLTRKRHTMPHPAQPRHTNHWAPRTRKQYQQEHWPQRPTESSDPMQHAKGRTGDCLGPRKGTSTRRNVTQGGVRLTQICSRRGTPPTLCLQNEPVSRMDVSFVFTLCTAFPRGVCARGTGLPPRFRDLDRRPVPPPSWCSGWILLIEPSSNYAHCAPHANCTHHMNPTRMTAPHASPC